MSVVPGVPTCRCPKGFTGSTCKRHTCQDHCLNGGNCSVNMGNQPTCSCPPEYQGDQCQYSERQHEMFLRDGKKRSVWILDLFCVFISCSGKCEGFCHNAGTCLQTSNGTKLCLCTTQYIGHQCELDKCLFCGTGKCLTSSSNEVTCRSVHCVTLNVKHLIWNIHRQLCQTSIQED